MLAAVFAALAECCLGWGHLFLRLGEKFIDLGRRAEIGDL